MAISVELTCTCSAYMSISSDLDTDGTAVWLLTYRFADAHVDCGLVTPVRKDPEPRAGKRTAVESDAEAQST